MSNIELIEEIDKLYFNRQFSFPFTANTTVKECIDSGYDLIHREIQSYVNLSLEQRLKEFGYVAFELSSWWDYKGRDKITKFSFIDFNPTIKDGKQEEVEEVAKICINFNRRVKDIAGDCLERAIEYLEKRDNTRQVLSGDLTWLKEK